MAWRYRGPKGFVSEGVYNRYKHLDTYKRVSDKHWREERKTLGERVQEERERIARDLKGQEDYQDLLKLYQQYNEDYINGEFEDQGEVETGVDYGEED